VPAHGHLASIDAAEGRVAVAVGCLRELAVASDDPDYAAKLASLLAESQAPVEAQLWRAHAARRYEELMARHPEAYAGHAAEFWLAVGGDPQRAHQASLQNLALRKTPRAHAQVDRASRPAPGRGT
jgi:hypothetical protein